MTHAVAFATIRTAKTREHLRKVLTQRNCEHCAHSNNNSCASSAFDDLRDRDLFRVLKRSPISRPHAIGLRRRCSDGKTRGNTTGLRRRLHSDWRISLLQSSWRLARLKQVPIFKVLVRPGRDSNHVEPRPTGHEASALPTRPHVRMIY